MNHTYQNCTMYLTPIATIGNYWYNILVITTLKDQEKLDTNKHVHTDQKSHGAVQAINTSEV